MSNQNERAELHAQIWKIANDVRGAVDGWDFKQYVLGTLFYRFISEDFSDYVEGGDEDFDYSTFDESEITEDMKNNLVEEKGYFIYPSQLFTNVAKNAKDNDNLNTELKEIFESIENSSNGKDSAKNVKGLFADFDTTSNRLGNTVTDKNKNLTAVLKGVEGLNFKSFGDNNIDLFGDAYEFLISNYASNAGKSGGEFFTPQCVSKLLAKLVLINKEEINNVYDPASGSGSLLLQVKKQAMYTDDKGNENSKFKGEFHGQEINHTTYNLCRMNMFLHGINYDKFNIALGNTLINPSFTEEDRPEGFDAIVSNPPYSIKWEGKDDPTLINDDRYAPAGVLAPKSKADFAFVLHALHHLSTKGRAVIVSFPGIFYRGGAEQKIRQYLIDRNVVEAVISLPPNLFFGTSIAVNILILSKGKKDNRTQFIDASGEDFYKKETNNNVLTEEHIDKIIEIFKNKEDVEYVSKLVRIEEIMENDYGLSVNTFVEAKRTEEIIDIKELNKEIKTTVNNIDKLRTSIEEIVEEIEDGK